MVSIEQIKAGSGPLRTRLERDQAASIASRQTKAGDPGIVLIDQQGRAIQSVEIIKFSRDLKGNLVTSFGDQPAGAEIIIPISTLRSFGQARVPKAQPTPTIDITEGPVGAPFSPQEGPATGIALPPEIITPRPRISTPTAVSPGASLLFTPESPFTPKDTRLDSAEQVSGILNIPEGPQSRVGEGGVAAILGNLQTQRQRDIARRAEERRERDEEALASQTTPFEVQQQLFSLGGEEEIGLAGRIPAGVRGITTPVLALGADISRRVIGGFGSAITGVAEIPGRFVEAGVSGFATGGIPGAFTGVAVESAELTIETGQGFLGLPGRVATDPLAIFDISGEFAAFSAFGIGPKRVKPKRTKTGTKVVEVGELTFSETAIGTVGRPGQPSLLADTRFTPATRKITTKLTPKQIREQLARDAQTFETAGAVGEFIIGTAGRRQVTGKLRERIIPKGKKVPKVDPDAPIDFSGFQETLNAQLIQPTLFGVGQRVVTRVRPTPARLPGGPVKIARTTLAEARRTPLSATFGDPLAGLVDIPRGFFDAPVKGAARPEFIRVPEFLGGRKLQQPKRRLRFAAKEVSLGGFESLAGFGFGRQLTPRVKGRPSRSQIREARRRLPTDIGIPEFFDFAPEVVQLRKPITRKAVPQNLFEALSDRGRGRPLAKGQVRRGPAPGFRRKRRPLFEELGTPRRGPRVLAEEITGQRLITREVTTLPQDLILGEARADIARLGDLLAPRKKRARKRKGVPVGERFQPIETSSVFELQPGRVQPGFIDLEFGEIAAPVSLKAAGIPSPFGPVKFEPTPSRVRREPIITAPIVRTRGGLISNTIPGFGISTGLKQPPILRSRAKPPRDIQRDLPILGQIQVPTIRQIQKQRQTTTTSRLRIPRLRQPRRVPREFFFSPPQRGKPRRVSQQLIGPPRRPQEFIPSIAGLLSGKTTAEAPSVETFFTGFEPRFPVRRPIKRKSTKTKTRKIKKRRR